MKILILTFLFALSVILTAPGASRTSPSYTVSAEVLDSGGGFSSSASYENIGSFGGFGGIASSGAFLVRSGYPAQLNNAPRSFSTNVSRARGSALAIKLSRLLENNTDPDGDSVGFAGVESATTAQGGSLQLDNGWIFYQPPAGFNSTDSFRYFVRDSEGDTTANTVTIVIDNSDPGVPRNIIGIIAQPDGSKRLLFVGLSGRIYSIQWTDHLGDPGSWRELDTAIPGSNGLFEYTDLTTDSVRFYRAIAR